MSSASSVLVPPVSDEYLQESCHFLGELSFPQGVLRVYWCHETREVLFNALWMRQWWLQFNGRIDESLSEILDVGCDELRVTDLWIREIASSEERLATTNEKSDFLGCKWSDYCYDFMKLRANISILDRNVVQPVVHNTEQPIESQGVSSPSRRNRTI